MLRNASNLLARRTAQRFAVAAPTTSSRMPMIAPAGTTHGSPVTMPVQYFHSTPRQEEDSADKAVAKEGEEKGFWDPIYAVPIGIAFAVPALNYEWILVNEETQLMACFIAFVSIIYKQFGGTIYDALEEDGKKILQEHNKVEDEIIAMLQHKVDDIKMQSNVVQDAEAVKALKLETYEKLNAAGKIKPQYEFKAQVERLVSLMEQEEVNMKEKAKVALMEEATEAVKAEFATSKEMKKTSLVNAIATLKGGAAKGSSDPVKDAYLKFFQKKAAEAKGIDEKKETLAAREAMLTKLNAVAKNEGFFFEFDLATGKPKMTV